MSLSIETNIKIVKKHASTLASSSSSEEHSLMEEKLANLETQYVQMEVEYSKKIKELRNLLADKCKRQASLMGQITNLREDFKIHQEQIAQVGQKLAQETNENSLKMTKKNSSPGLIKKSVDNDIKYEKKQSPSHNLNSSNKYGLKIIGQVKKTDYVQNCSPTIKRRSPRANPNGILHILKQESLQHIPVLQKQKNIFGQEHHSGKKYIQPTSGDKKKAYSPKNLQQAKPLNTSSARVLKKPEPIAASNASPKRPIRRSPGLKAAPVPNVQPKQQGRKLLGRLKQTTAEIEEVF